MSRLIPYRKRHPIYGAEQPRLDSPKAEAAPQAANELRTDELNEQSPPLNSSKAPQPPPRDTQNSETSLKLGVPGVPMPAGHVESFYDIGRKEYLVQDGRGVWMHQNEGQFRRRCKMHGISGRTIEGTCHSPFDAFVTKLQQERGVDFSGELAGYKSGIYEESGSRILVTKGPMLVEPQAGDFPLVRKVLQNVLADDNHDQITFFHGWLSVATRALHAGQRAPGQALVLVGPANAGKSLLQDIITEILGGRSAKPYSFMTGATHFNGHLAGAEHLRIGDENPLTDMRSRRNFGAQIKTICVEPLQNIEHKYRTAITLKPFWRLSISLNDEPENLLVLPPLDEHTLEKLILLRAYKREMPMPTATNEHRYNFWRALVSQFPAYIYWLLNDFEIPATLVCERFGITHFHHPEITAGVEQFEPYMRLLTLVDIEIFKDNLRESPWEGSAEQLERELTREGSVCAREARQLLSWNGSTARYLGKLWRAHPERVERLSHEDARRWRIRPPDTVDT